MTILTSQNQTTTISINQTGFNWSTNAWFINYEINVRTVLPDATISTQSGIIDFPDAQVFIDSWSTVNELNTQCIQRVIAALGITEWTGVVESPLEEAPWVVGQVVDVNAIRTYSGTTYICRQLHITQLSWTPNATPALWSVYTPPLSAWVQPTGAQDSYQIGDRVTHNGNTWESTANNNVWEPGVFGWVIV